MSLTYKQATDEMKTMLLNVATYQIFWESVRDDRQQDEDPWGSVSIRHAVARQDTLGGTGNRSFLRQGTMLVAIFTQAGKGLSIAYELARVSVNAYEGQSSPSGVWFRNVRVQEMGRDGEFYQINVIVEFEYYETK
jgi:hypothetical protein